jgi:hypothetical protein
MGVPKNLGSGGMALFQFRRRSVYESFLPSLLPPNFLDRFLARLKFGDKGDRSRLSGIVSSSPLRCRSLNLFRHTNRNWNWRTTSHLIILFASFMKWSTAYRPPNPVADETATIPSCSPSFTPTHSESTQASDKDRKARNGGARITS